jgi:hypothetical protein
MILGNPDPINDGIMPTNTDVGERLLSGAGGGKHWQELHSEAAQEIAKLRTLLKSTRAELGRERLRLAACGVVALANTPESALKAREMLPEYRSASLDDVESAVDREMQFRAELEALKTLHKV